MTTNCSLGFCNTNYNPKRLPMPIKPYECTLSVIYWWYSLSSVLNLYDCEKAATDGDGSAFNWAKTLLADISLAYRWPKKTISLGTGLTVRLCSLRQCCSSDVHDHSWWPAPVMFYRSRSYPFNLLLEVPCRLCRGTAQPFVAWIIRGWWLGSKRGMATTAGPCRCANGPPY